MNCPAIPTCRDWEEGRCVEHETLGQRAKCLYLNHLPRDLGIKTKRSNYGYNAETIETTTQRKAEKQRRKKGKEQKEHKEANLLNQMEKEMRTTQSKTQIKRPIKMMMMAAVVMNSFVGTETSRTITYQIKEHILQQKEGLEALRATSPKEQTQAEPNKQDKGKHTTKKEKRRIDREKKEKKQGGLDERIRRRRAPERTHDKICRTK